MWHLANGQDARRHENIEHCGMVNEVHVDNFNIYWLKKV